jgi:carbonic anhydrase/acetyltransferase-like protein (isoleucine patch superfamily)
VRLVSAALPVVRLRMAEPLPPLEGGPEAWPVLDGTLAASQDAAVRAAGLGPIVDRPPASGPWLAIGDHTWVTAPFLRRFLEACPPEGGVAELSGPFVTFSRPLQDGVDGERWRVPVAVFTSGGADPARLAAAPSVPVDVAATLAALPDPHPAMAHASTVPIPVTDTMAHPITHWSHLLRVNLLGLVAFAEGQKRATMSGPALGKLWAVARLVAKARSFDKWRLAAAIGPQGRGCTIHPTATVEACVLGDGVEVGPHAVVRASWLAAGAKVQEHAMVNLTVAGPGATIGRGAMVNLCVLGARSFLSAGWGFQACVLGPEAFVAMGACFYDLSFGSEVEVLHRGARVSAGTHFLGVAVGPRAKVGPNVIVGYGEAIPADAFLVGDPGRMFRRIPAALPRGPVTARDGAIVPVGRPRG